MSEMQGMEKKQQALQAFQRDLPELYSQHPGKWVAYQGDQRLGFAEQKHLLYQQCLERGLHRDDFVVFCIEPQETEMMIGPIVLE